MNNKTKAMLEYLEEESQTMVNDKSVMTYLCHNECKAVDFFFASATCLTKEYQRSLWNSANATPRKHLRIRTTLRMREYYPIIVVKSCRS